MSRGSVGSLGRKLSLWLAMQSLIGLAGVCGIVYAVTAFSVFTRQSETMEQKVAHVRHLQSETLGDFDAEALRHKLDDFLIGHQDMSLTLQRPDGITVYASPPRSGEGADARELRFTLPTHAGVETVMRVTPTMDTRNDRRLLRRVGWTLLVAALAGAALVSAGGFFLVRLSLRPLRDLVRQTRSMAADTLHRKLDGSAQPDELQPLIAQFNDLLSRLRRAYEHLEGFNADVAHELCTPLATLIGSTELALRRARNADELREVLGANLEDLQRVAGIVQDMLFLSQADRGAVARRAPVGSLADIARGVADYHLAALAEAGLGMSISGDASGEFDVPLLQRALSNLFANATRHAKAGTDVSVNITASAGVTRIYVTNLGVTVEPEHLPYLFDRFYRVDRARSGAVGNHGLGLAIVAAIAQMHGGRTEARSVAGVTSIGFEVRMLSGATSAAATAQVQ